MYLGIYIVLASSLEEIETGKIVSCCHLELLRAVNHQDLRLYCWFIIRGSNWLLGCLLKFTSLCGYTILF